MTFYSAQMWWIGLDVKSKTRACRFDSALVELGGRVSTLLMSKKTQSNDFAIATLDDLLGAIYALILAFHNSPSFKYRSKGQCIDPRAVLKRARSVKQAGGVRTTGKWMAGFHFNSALFRLAAVYHRSLKIAVGRPTCRDHVGRERDPSSLISQAKREYNAWVGHGWSNVNVQKVHMEVNGLKHKSAGIYWGRDVNEVEATSAAKELLDLLVAWNSQP